MTRAAARHFRAELSRVRAEAGPPETGIATRVEVRLEPLGAPLPATQDVMATVRAGTARMSPLFEQLEQAAAPDFRATVWLFTPASHAVALEEILGEPEHPKTLAEVATVRARFRGVLEHLEAALREAIAERTSLEAQLGKRRQDLAAERQRIGSPRYALDAVLWSRKKMLRRTEQTVTAFRDSRVALSEAEARVDALESGRERIRADMARYEAQWLTRVESALEDAVRGGPAFNAVSFVSLDAIYADLLAATERAEGERDDTTRREIARPRRGSPCCLAGFVSG